MRIVSWLIFCSVTLLFSGCGGKEMQSDVIPTAAFDAVSPAAWNSLSGKKIFFGHQSVGYNIIDGIGEVMPAAKELNLNLVESRDPAVFSVSVFAHARVGANLDPISKCRDFEAIMDRGIGDKADYAFLKFCYADITAKTDLQSVFSEYRDMIRRLEQKYPKTRFISITVPLTYQKAGIKTRIKLLIGKSEIWEYDDNIRRFEYNEMLRKEFGKDLFDLAFIESMNENGTRESFNVSRKTYFALSPEYAEDGGHLNSRGRNIVAKSLLAYLASL
jgi:lysophospholipase L1-like esterase